MKPPRSVNKIFTHSDDKLASLVTRSKQLKAITLQIREFLPEKFASHCYVADVNDDMLSIFVDGAALAARLRMMSSDILRKLHEESHNFKYIQRLSFKVLAPLGESESRTPEPDPIRINAENAQQMAQFAEAIEDEDLKAALLRLASHGKNEQ